MTARVRNIVLYSANLPPDSLGGIETNAFYLIKHLLGVEGIRLHVVTLTKKRFTLTRSKRVPIGDRTIAAQLLKKRDTQTPTKLLRLLDRLQCRPEDTVIYYNTLDLHRLYCAIKQRGYAQVARSGGNDIFFIRSKDPAGSEPIDNFAQLDLLFVNSEYSLRRALEAGFDKRQLRVVKGGCSREQNTPPLPDTGYQHPIILSCCRLVDFKGLEDAIDACHLLDRQELGFTYLLIGEGELKSALQARIECHGLQHKCLLIGSMPPDQVHAYYRLADIYLSASKDVIKRKGGVDYVHTETMGRSLCEAQAYGLPVVSTDAGGSPEMVIPDTTGLVVAQSDVPAIAGALGTLIRDEPRRRQMGEHAAQHAAQDLSWHAVFTQVTTTLDSLVNR